MFKFPNLIITVVAIFVSFLLFEFTAKLNLERSVLLNINQTCRLYGYTNANCSFFMRQRIENDYSATIDELVEKKNLKLIYLSFLPVCLILSLFIVFAADKNEILLSFASIIPLVLLLGGSDDAWLIPFFLISLPACAFLFLRLKYYLYFGLPQGF